MRVLYSHHSWVKDTPVEVFEMDTIVNLCKKNLIPSNTQEEVTLIDQYRSDSLMEDLDSCQYVVFTAISGMISQEIYNMVICALNREKEVYFCTGASLYQVKSTEGFVSNFVKKMLFNGDRDIYATVKVS